MMLNVSSPKGVLGQWAWSQIAFNVVAGESPVVAQEATRTDLCMLCPRWKETLWKAQWVERDWYMFILLVSFSYGGLYKWGYPTIDSL